MTSSIKADIQVPVLQLWELIPESLSLCCRTGSCSVYSTEQTLPALSEAPCLKPLMQLAPAALQRQASIWGALVCLLVQRGHLASAVQHQPNRFGTRAMLALYHTLRRARMKMFLGLSDIICGVMEIF